MQTELFMYRSVACHSQARLQEILEKYDRVMSSAALVNRGKGLDEVEYRQRRRKIMALKESCKKAIWFADSFDLDLQSIILKTRKKHEEIKHRYNTPINAFAIDK